MLKQVDPCPDHLPPGGTGTSVPALSWYQMRLPGRPGRLGPSGAIGPEYVVTGIETGYGSPTPAESGTIPLPTGVGVAVGNTLGSLLA